MGDKWTAELYMIAWLTLRRDRDSAPGSTECMLGAHKSYIRSLKRKKN